MTQAVKRQPAADTDAQVLQVLAEIRDRLDCLPAFLDALQRVLSAQERGPIRPATLKAEDYTALARILPVLREQFTGKFGTWLVADVAEQQTAAGKNLRLVLEQRTARQLGKLFQRAADIDVEGLRIVRSGQDGSGALWECVESGLAMHSHTVDSEERG